MPELPAGTVTYLFTDIAGSTALWELAGQEMARALVRHDEVVDAAVRAHGGHLVKARGEGDSRFAVFRRPRDAVVSAAQLVRALRDEPWPTPAPIAVRVAVHAGEAEVRTGDYYGPAVNRTAQLRAVGHPNQILLSGVAAAAAGGELPDGLALRDLGEHRLRDLIEPVHVYQLLGPGLPADFPPLSSLDRTRHNLPRQLTEFVGREFELAGLSKLLRADRLVTVTGPGGTGKTRLAIQVAAEAVDEYADGVWVVELAGVTEDDLVADTVARALGVPVVGRPAKEATREFLRTKAALLVLDNCEQVVAGCAELARTFLTASPDLRILATSRRSIGVAGEHLWPLDPLEHPDPAHLPPTDALGDYDAVRLFVQRARSADPTFKLEDDNARAVAEVCARLDGIPLAIELAAARVRLLHPSDLAARLGDRFRLLGGGAPDAKGRHESLQATLDWSWELLAPPEQVALRRAAVFAGGFDLQTAEPVLADEHLDLDEVVDAVAGLVDHSLVVPAPWSDRYRLLDTVRAYAQDKLVEAGEEELVRDRHLRWFADWEDGRERQAPLPSMAERGKGFEREGENIWGALSWGLDRRRPDALRLAGALPHPFWARGNTVRALRMLTACLDAFPDAPPDVRARAHGRAAHLFSNTSELQQSRQHGEIALRLAEEDGIDERWVPFSMGSHAYVIRGEEGEALAERGRNLALARGWRASAAVCCQALGVICEDRGDLERAAAWFREGTELTERDARGPGRGRILGSLAAVTERLGRADEAEGLWGEVLRISMEGAVPDPTMEGLARAGLARSAMSRSEVEAAEDYFRDVLRIGREVAMGEIAAIGLGGLLEASERRGDVASVLSLANQVVEELRARRDPHLVHALVALGRAAVAEDETLARVVLAEAIDIARTDRDRNVCWECTTAGALSLLDADGCSREAVLLLTELLRNGGQLPAAAVQPTVTGLARAANALGRPVIAARLLGAAAAVGANDEWTEKLPPILRAHLGSALFDEAFGEGQAWHAETVVGRVLEEAGPLALSPS